MTDRSSIIITAPGTDYDDARDKIDDYQNKNLDLKELPSIILVWSDKFDSKDENLLTLADNADVRVSVRFPNLTLGQITGVIFQYRCVEPIVVSTFRLTKDKGLKIGTDWGNDIDQYDDRRFHTLILHSKPGSYSSPERRSHGERSRSIRKPTS